MELIDSYLNPKQKSEQCMRNPELSEAFLAKKEETLEAIVKQAELFNSTTKEYLKDQIAKTIFQQMEQYPLPYWIIERFKDLKWKDIIYGKVNDLQNMIR
mmetsp:Transcript_39544/g.60406  ORF Transcript_39544/g.60406 Transcript_39544/m.60406 type:complete len:100 (-) Transcript_39544:211-510(-)